MKLLLFTLLCSTFQTIYSQYIYKWSVDLNYPITYDQNFLGSNFNGVIDAGTKFRFIDKNELQAGVGTSISLFANFSDITDRPDNIQSIGYLIQPKLFLEWTPLAFQRFHGSIALGYSFLGFSTNGIKDGVDINISSKIRHGINPVASLAFDLTHTLFVQLQYDYIRLNLPGQLDNITFNTTISLLKFGAGYRF